ncbi:Small ubiquitin-related modifier 1 [Ranunculus cassubicifolius]
MSGNTPQKEEKKPNDQSGVDHINLKFKGQDGNEVFFRIKRSTQLKKLMTTYCDRQSLEMEDGDEIDAMVHQTGYGYL